MKAVDAVMVHQETEILDQPVELEAELKKRAQAAGKNVTTKVYDGAGHAFLADYRPTYREGPAFQLWGDILVYFDKHLRS